MFAILAFYRHLILWSWTHTWCTEELFKKVMINQDITLGSFFKVKICTSLFCWIIYLKGWFVSLLVKCFVPLLVSVLYPCLWILLEVFLALILIEFLLERLLMWRHHCNVAMVTERIIHFSIVFYVSCHKLILNILILKNEKVNYSLCLLRVL